MAREGCEANTLKLIITFIRCLCRYQLEFRGPLDRLCFSMAPSTEDVSFVAVCSASLYPASLLA